MASSINASTSGAGGIIATSDNSGILNLQSSGTTVATIQPSGLTLPAGATINTANTFGFKNRIINGNMRIWQRGTSFPSVGAIYTADRWTSSTSILMAATQSTDVPNAQFNYSFKFAPAVNGTPTEMAVRQFIEQQNISDFAGQTVTVSLWAKCSQSTFKVRCAAYNATGGQDQTTTFTVTPGVWTKVTASYTSFSNVTGWTVGPTLSGSFVDVGFVNSTALTTSDYLYFTGVQLEVGSQATTFDVRDYGRELIMCYRYYRRWTGSNAVYSSLGVGSTGSASVIYRWGFNLDVPVRAAPSITFSGCVGYNGVIGGTITVNANYSSTNYIDADLNTSGLTATVGLAAKILMYTTAAYIELTGAEL